MKSLLLIAWLSLFLPAFLRGEAACDSFVQSSSTSLTDNSPSCSCCEAGSCACSVEPGQETPDLPSPALPPSPDNSGKLIAARLAYFLLSPAAQQPTENKSLTTPGENTADSRGNLPLHIKYCSRLW